MFHSREKPGKLEDDTDGSSYELKKFKKKKWSTTDVDEKPSTTKHSKKRKTDIFRFEEERDNRRSKPRRRDRSSSRRRSRSKSKDSSSDIVIKEKQIVEKKGSTTSAMKCLKTISSTHTTTQLRKLLHSRGSSRGKSFNKRHENCFKSPNASSTHNSIRLFDSPTNRYTLKSLSKTTNMVIKKTHSKSMDRTPNTSPLLSARSSKNPLNPTHSQISNRSSFIRPFTSDSRRSSKSLLSVRQGPSRSVSPTLTIDSRDLKSQIRSCYSPKYFIRKHKNNDEMLQMFREQVDRAIKERKTFSVCGNYQSIRRSLLARGWVEKIHVNYSLPDKDNIRKLLGQQLIDLVPSVHDKTNGGLYKRIIMSKMLGRHQVDFFWDYNTDAFKLNPDNVKLTIINNIRKGVYSYSTKKGLCELMKRSHWYHAPGIAFIQHPRSYTLTENGDPDEFIRDFKITAAMSLLKWIVYTHENSVSRLISDSGKVLLSVFNFALKECEKVIQKFKHEDIDYMIDEALEFDWNQFLEQYYKCVHIGNHFKNDGTETEQSLVHKSKIMLVKLKKCCPCLQMDGFMNIWILKPTAGSRGIGIHICRTLQYVLKVVSENKSTRYIIQKYIERPLLIYNTKFDIRQWFLISCASPLTIWIYKECYLRFSSQTYNLRKLHESIHLTNNSVQCKYKNNNRDPGLPEYNMWESKKFRDYLEMIGYPYIYDEVIFPGMKECITAAILINQDYINTRKNCFELYGADFMLTEDFKPWLIEINSRPALYASTPVTSKMCPQVLEDVVKVVVDHARHQNASTGLFQLLYKEILHPLPPLDSSALKIRGHNLPPEYFYTPETSALEEFKQPEKKSSDIININNTQNYMKYVSRQMKKTLENLLDIIHKERERRRGGNYKRRDNYLTMKSEKIPLDLENESIEYIDNVNKVNDNIKEIQEILKPKYISDKRLNELVTTLETNKVDNQQDEDVLSVSSERELNEVYYSSNELLESEKKLPEKYIELPKRTDSQLRMETVRIEKALMKISASNNKNHGCVFGDFLSFLNVWKNKTHPKQTY